MDIWDTLIFQTMRKLAPRNSWYLRYALLVLLIINVVIYYPFNIVQKCFFHVQASLADVATND